MENTLPNPDPNKSNPSEALSHNARLYFLKQGQSISQLHEMLSNGYFRGFVTRFVFWMIEFVLYALFLISIVFILFIPTSFSKEVQIDGSNTLDIGYTNDELLALMLFMKFFLFILSLIPLILARVLRASRRKTSIIQNAFEHVDTMKQEFDTAIKNLTI